MPLQLSGKRNSHKIPLYKLPPCFTPNGLYGHHSTETYLGDFLNMPQKDNLQSEKRQIANKLMKKRSTPTWIKEMEKQYTPQWNMPLCYPIRRVFQKKKIIIITQQRSGDGAVETGTYSPKLLRRRKPEQLCLGSHLTIRFQHLSHVCKMSTCLNPQPHQGVNHEEVVYEMEMSWRAKMSTAVLFIRGPLWAHWTLWPAHATPGCLHLALSRLTLPLSWRRHTCPSFSW